MSVGAVIAEPLVIQNIGTKSDHQDRAMELMKAFQSCMFPRRHVIDLMQELHEQMKIEHIFISRDMAVMINGKIVEHGSRRSVFENLQNDYTRSSMRYPCLTCA